MQMTFQELVEKIQEKGVLVEDVRPKKEYGDLVFPVKKTVSGRSRRRKTVK